MDYFNSLLRRPPSWPAKSSLQSGFVQVVAQLKSIYRNQRRAQLAPWYLLMGLPGSGKSSLLQNESSVAWRKISSYHEVDSNITCDWWHTGAAVVVDLDGRYMVPNENQGNARWFGFTGLLQRHRKPTAVNAVLLVVSASELMQSDAEGRRRQAGLLRQQLDELQMRCSRRIPCYLIVSKSDSLAGFGDYFAAISPIERQQIWGFALPAQADGEKLTQHMKSLLDRLQSILPQRLQAERDAAARRSMLGFPLQFEQLQSHILQFVGVCFPSTCLAAKATTDAPELRGVYLTGGAASARARYFLDSLFSDVIFSDPTIAQVTSAHRRNASASYRTGVAAVVVTTMLALACWSVAFANQQRGIKAASEILLRSENMLTYGSPTTLEQADNAISLLQRAAALATANSAYRITMLGMREQTHVDAIQAIQDTTLEQRWLPTLSERVLQQVPHYEDNDAQFNALKAWFMLIDPTHRDMRYLQHWFDTSSLFDATQRAQIHSRLNLLHKLNPRFAVTSADTRTVAPLQQKLRSISLQERIYNLIRTRYLGQTLALKPLLGANTDAVFVVHDQSLWNMPAFFTAPTYRALKFNANMPEINEVEREQWVLDDIARPLSQQQRQQLALDLQQRYQQDYVNSWNRLFNGLSVRQAASPAELLHLLQPLSDADTSPLTTLLHVASEHTQVLEGSYPTLVVTPTKAATLATTLADLRNWLNTVYRADDIGDAAVNTMASPGDYLDPPRRTLVFAEELPVPVSHWIAALAHAARNFIANTASGNRDTEWRQQVADFCKAHIGNRYPFANTSGRTVSYGNFVDYFRPGGIEDSFVRTQLGNDIDRNNWSPRPGAAIKPSSSALQMMKQAQKIRLAFFDNANPGFAYRITPTRMSAKLQQFDMIADTANLHYSHGPRLAYRFAWPQQDEAISTRFTSLNGSTVARNYSGAWALYRMMDASTRIEHTDNGAIRLTLREGGQDMELALSPLQEAAQDNVKLPYNAQTAAPVPLTMASNPLHRDLLSGYRCIDRLR
jgi:type VI secretion system protein ImpL